MGVDSPARAPARRVEHLSPPASVPGCSHALAVVRYGAPGARPKVYMQAALHADETPGMLVLNHLIQRLDAVADAIRGEIVLVPMANPLGLAQWVSGRLVGRYALGGAGNYNRSFPDLGEAAEQRLRDTLGDSAAHNLERVREALGAALADLEPVDETQWLRHTLLGLALDADIALDLHCDEEALLHVYLSDAHWPGAADLAAELGARAVLLAESSGGDPFDEALSLPWARLARRFPQRPIPPGCMSATVELRGYADTSDANAAADAASLHRFLVRRGAVAGDPGPGPSPLATATPLTGMDIVRAPHGGAVAWLAPLGARVASGEVVARLADPLALERPAARTEVRSRAEGLLIARADVRFVRAGDVLVKIAGPEPLAHRARGALLTD